MVVQRGDQPVGQLAEQARSFQPGDLLLLEGVLHVLLDPRLVPSERAKGRVAGDRTAVPGQRSERLRKDGGGRLWSFRQGEWGQHPRDRTRSPPCRELPASISGGTMRPTPRAGSS